MSTEEAVIGMLTHAGLSEDTAYQLSAAWDILSDAGFPREQKDLWLEMALRDGRNPEEIARTAVEYKRLIERTGL